MAKIQRVAFAPEPTLTPLGQAVSLALSIMRAAKVTQFSQLAGEVPYKVALLPGQLALLRDHLRVISFLRSAGMDPAGTHVKTVSVAICPTCNRWFQLSDSAPKTCPITLGCPGQPAKVAAADRVELPEVEDGRAQTPPA